MFEASPIFLLVVVGYFGKDGVEFVFITKFVVDIV